MTDPTTGSRESFWERSTTGWHATFYGLVGVMAVVVAYDDDVSDRSRPVGLALLVVLAAAYTVIGRHALGGERLRRSVAYLTLAWLVLGGLVAILPDALLLLLVLSPQTWAMLPTRAAAGWNVGGTAWLVGVQVAGGAAVDGALIFGAVNMTISLLLGLWITGIVQESEQRACLIAELERTRTDLAASEHERGILAERERLAHEIHDTLAQGFTSVLALAQAAEISLDRDAARAQQALSMIQGTARDNLAEARALVGALTPPDLAGSSLPDALRRVVPRFADESGVDAALAVDGQVRALPQAAEVVLLRTVQESLSNVRKHAKAATVDVRLTYGPDDVRLVVTDDGRGFDPAEASGHGLPGMRARVEQIGGAVTVATVQGEGTTVSVRVPDACR